MDNILWYYSNPTLPLLLRSGDIISDISKPLPKGVLLKVIGKDKKVLREIDVIYTGKSTATISIEEPVKVEPGQELQVVVRRNSSKPKLLHGHRISVKRKADGKLTRNASQ